MKKVRVLLMILFTLLLSCLHLPASAVNHNNLITEIKVKSDQIKKGDKIEVLLSIKSNDSTIKGFNAFQATLDYDEEVFEKVKQSDFEALNSWSELLYNPDNKKFVVINKSSNIEKEDAIKLTLTAKENASPTKTSIKIKDAVASDGEKDIKIDKTQDNPEVQIEITDPKQEAENAQGGSSSTGETESDKNPPNSDTGSNENTSVGSTNSNSNSNSNSNDTQVSNGEQNNLNQETIADEDSSQDVEKDESNKKYEENDSNNDVVKSDGSYKKKSISPLTWIIVIIIEIILLVAIIIIIKKKLEEKDKEISKKHKLIFAVIVVFIILIQMVGIARAIGKKGELNGDGDINYKDVSLLQQHLIDLNKLPDEFIENADINSDGKITVTDLSLLIQKIEDSLVYTVEIQSNMENYYPNKNEDIELKFLANASFGAIVEEATINDKTYKVKFNPDVNEYSVKVNVGDTCGIKEYKFTKVKLDVGKEVDVEFTEKIDILKEKPVIENYRITEITKEAKMQVNFDIKDTDNSITDANVEIVEKESSEVVYKGDVKVGENEVVADLEEKKDYLVNICVNYNLDTDELTDHEQDNTGSIFKSYELRLNIDYKFEFNNLKTLNDKGEKTSSFNKNEPIVISFASENATMFNPETVKVNDIIYDLTKDGDKYLASINGITNTGEHEIKIQEIVLDNGKVFELQKNNVVKVNINKEMPKVEDVTIKELDNKVALDVDLKISDPDKSITKKKLVIKDDKNKIILEKEFSELEYKGISELGDILSSKFVVEIWADYDLSVDSTTPLVNQVVYTKTIDAKQRVRILESSLSSQKVEKGDMVSITYKLESNQNSQVKTLLVNNIKAIATKKGDNLYEATINVDDSAGLSEINLSKVIFDNDVEVVVSKKDSIEILKSIPKVNNYHAEDDINSDIVNVAFDLEDEDNAFVSGKVELYRNDGTLHKTYDINSVGENNFDLSVIEGEEYTLKVKVKYKRDEDATEVKEEVLLEKSILLIKDYQLHISDIKTSNSKGNTKYFNKDEQIKVSFISTNATIFEPVKAKINNKEYTLTKLENNVYETTIDGFDSSGVCDITVEKVWLNNSKELDVDANTKTQIEVLKIAPTVQGFTYEQTQDDSIKVMFDIKDEESAFTKGKLIISDKNSTVLSTDDLKVGKNEFTFKTTSSEEYKAEVLLDYDLDTNALGAGDNEYLNVKVVDDNIVISKELIELKDIESVKLYRKNGESTEEVSAVDTKNFTPEDYIAKITMKNIPTLYAEIKEGKVVGNEFRLVLNYNNGVQYENSQRRNEIEVKFAEVDNNIATNITFAELIDKIQKNPTATINLTSDLDASTLSVATSTYLGDFKGTINGNGHTIKNLTKPLFNNIQNATIENLVIENAKLSGSSCGILANTAIESTLTNVHINNSSVNTGHANGTGGLVGKAESNTIIQECSLNNISMQGYKFVGGFTGFLKTGSVIKDSYIKGTVRASWDAIGGVVGQTEGDATLENVYADVDLNMSADWATAGLVGYSVGNVVVLKNNISLATGNQGFKLIGTNYSSKSANNYEIEESTLKPKANGSNIKSISVKSIDEDFLRKELGWDETVWNLSGATGDNMPTLNNLDPTNQTSSSKPENSTVYIPEFERISKLSQYDSNKEIAYHNMNILMPYVDAKLYVDYGNNIGLDDVLNKKKILEIIAYNQDSKMISGLNTNNYNSIKKIKLVFEDKEVKEYNVAFNKLINNIATYKIDSLNISYAYNKFVLNTDISVINEIIGKAKDMDYATDISSVTPEEESRLYVDYYNESVKSRINDIIIKILQNEDEYNLYLDNEILKTKIKNDLFNDKQLQKLIYTYNYFDKWYKIDIGGIDVSELLFLNGYKGLKTDFGIKEMVASTMSLTQSERATQNTIKYYDKIIKPQTGMTITELLEHIMSIEGINDPDEWFADNFEGVLSEKPIKGKEDEIDYRAWTQLNKVNTRTNLLLPILTAPQEDMYIISVPSQFAIGSLNRYSAHVNGNTEEMNDIINQYTTRISNFYNTSASFIENSAALLNKKTQVHYDSRQSFPNIGHQYKGTTEDPVLKWVYEAVDKFPAMNNAGAYATGDDVFWVVYAALSKGMNSFTVFSHETSHNQDGYYYYENYGRRPQTGPEDHADSNIEQEFGDGGLQFNLTEDFSMETDISHNFTLARVTGKDNVYSYYREMFETYYVLDYLTAQAFLTLSPEQQSKLATQANDTPGNTVYSALTAADFERMDLDTMEDLWDNKIVFRDAGTVGGGTYGLYGGDNHYNIYWYQPHNDNGRADSYSFKKQGFELLGVGGYTNGYVAQRSGMSKNDLEALRIATGNPTITWKEYKMDRFEQVKNNLSKVPYFDTAEAIEWYKEALIKDAEAGSKKNTNNVRRVLFGMVKRVTNDFQGSTIYEYNSVKEVSSADELIAEVENNPIGSFKLTSNLDFSNIDVSNKEAYIENTFFGIIDGNGFEITGLTKPLMKKSAYSYIKNITIKEPIYNGSTPASVIIESKNSMLENVKVIDANIQVPYVNTKQGVCLEFGDMQNTILDNVIRSVDDLKKINEDTTGLAKRMKYTLGADIDVSSITSGSAIITGEFSGKIDGNGYEIRNSKLPLFQDLRGTVTNLNFENATLGGNGVNNVAALASSSNSATIENIRLNNVNVVGRDNASSLVGVARDTNINRVTATNINVTGTNFYAGGLIGRSYSTNVSNVVVSGELTITKTHNGGIIGAMNDGSLLNAYGNVKINRPSNNDNRAQNGGLIGTFENRKGTIKNSIAVNDVNSDVYKVIAAKDDNNLQDIKNNVQNVYEISTTSGLTSVNPEGNISAISQEKLLDINFYTNTLMWNTEIWDLSQVANGGMPIIK